MPQREPIPFIEEIAEAATRPADSDSGKWSIGLFLLQSVDVSEIFHSSMTTDNDCLISS